MIKYEHVLLYLIKPPNLEGKKKIKPATLEE